MMNCMMSCMERSQVKDRYTGGRKGVPRTWLEMEKESPTGEIYRTDVFVKTHKVTPDDNPSSSKSLAAATLVSIGEEEYDKDPLAQKCLGTDAVTKFLAVKFMKTRLQKEKQKAEALKAQLDVERQKNNTGVHDHISNTSYQQDIGMPVIPSSFGIFFLSLRKKPVAVAYVETKVLIDDDYDCMLQGVIEPNAMLCDRDDVVLQDVPIGTLIRCPRAYVTPIAELSS
ncbi:hypothetical protein C5167_011497 [Papaver somniferum]|uniref:Uncharacterized protein n=1 Tax=Papaver somniferum TaxID=3469 RepID=A0A4Y7K748_PAPSO|nr:hypothetical protein C5167_011497 [Papaver somniferum]